MHYYQHHIGDFIRDTARLSDSQCMAYLRMIWLYYETEQPLTSNLKVLSLKLGGSEDDIALLLEAFFKKEDGVWIHARCEREIEAYRRMADGGRQGAAKRWSKGSDAPPMPPLSGGNRPPYANQEPITNNHKPKDKNISAFAPPIPDDLLQDWLEVRKAKKAGKLTETAWKGVEREAIKAGLTLEQAVRICCERGWQSFRADWNWRQSSAVKPQSTNDRRAAVTDQIWGRGGDANGQHGQIIDVVDAGSVPGDRALISAPKSGIR